MNMKKIVYILITILFSAAVLTSCFEDKGSDKYDPFGQITVSGIEGEYSLISFADVLEINPQVTSTDPSDSFEYLWTIYENTNVVVGGYIKTDTIGREKDLHYPLNLSPGTYTVILRVANAANGYAEFFNTTLRTGTPFTTGYYFLKQTADGNTEMDFRNPAGDMFYNLLKERLGEPLQGTPNRLTIVSGYSYMDLETTESKTGTIIMPTSVKDVRLMLVADLSLVYDHKTMFYGETPEDEVPHVAFLNIFDYPFYLSSKGSYMTSSGIYGYPTVPAGGCSMSKHMIFSPGFNGYPITASMFDELNGRFVKVDYNNYLLGHIDNNGLSSSNIRHKLLFMGTSATSSAAGWAIFEDETDSTVRYLYRLASATTNSITSIVTINPSLHFNRAQIYGTNKSMQRLYGAIGDKLYMYNAESGEETELTPTGFGTGEEITMITHKNGQGNYLIIATYKDGKYKVYMYIMSGGAPYGAPEIVAEGTGKVVDIQHTGTTNGYINH